MLRGVSLSVRRGEFLAIVGQSGCGKSTLLHLLGTLDVPDRGEIYYAGRRIDNLPAKARDSLRNAQFGMIFQFYHLLPELSTLENVLTPLMIARGAWSYLRHRRAHRARAEELLEMVGLGHRLKHRPRELSGGEMQRRGHRPGPRGATQLAAGRRTYRQSRPGQRPGHHPHPANLEPPAERYYSDGYARPDDRQPGRLHCPAGERADRRVNGRMPKSK